MADLTVTDLGAGRYQAAGTAVVDNGDGTFTITSAGVTDLGGGVYQLTDNTGVIVLPIVVTAGPYLSILVSPS